MKILIFLSLRLNMKCLSKYLKVYFSHIKYYNIISKLRQMNVKFEIVLTSIYLNKC